MTSERQAKYRISTMLVEDADGKRFVIKRAMTSDAIEHIHSIEENAAILIKIYGKEHVSACSPLDARTLSFEYVDGVSLLNLLQRSILAGDQEKIKKYLNFYKYKILPNKEKTTVQQIAINPIGREQNLDLSFDNIIITSDDKWKIIDYEWLTTGLSRDFLYVRALAGALTRIGNNRERLLKNFLNDYPNLLEKMESFEYKNLEKTFLDKVLLFPHERYKHRQYSLDDLLEQERLKITKKQEALIQSRDNQLLQIKMEKEKGFRTKDIEIVSLKNHINNIENSRGYRLVQCYYRVRDKMLPRGSIRRLFIKNAVWILLHPHRTASLCTLENIQKIIEAWKFGGIRQLVSRVDGKLQSPSVEKISTLSDEKIETHNFWLDDKPEISLPNNVVIDIIVPVYNALEFTKKCIEGVMKNTDVDYRLIIIDDCSPDTAVEEYFQILREIKPSGHLKELLALKNEKNLGFLGTVNRAFSIAHNHIVLLNTDTEVPPKWLSRLIWPLFSTDKIATVTPFSNSAEICSFPKFVQNNDLPKGLDITTVDSLFQCYGEHAYVEIPTGVGFAMAINYHCLQEIGGFDVVFDKGYCEENDFCRRAVNKGWINVHIRDLFIYHKHGASFATRKDASKAQRLAKNLAILNRRYPGYDCLIQEYISKDPCRTQRVFLAALVRALQEKQKGKKGILFLNHSLGGGTQSYQQVQIQHYLEKDRVYSATILADGCSFVVYEHELQKNINGKEIARFDYNKMTEIEYRHLIKALAIDDIFINHLLGFHFPDFLDWNQKCGIPYMVFLHDFYCVCPRYNLINDKGTYCHAEKSEKVCRNCLKNHCLVRAIDVHTWRKKMGDFLAGAYEIRVPSQNTADIVHSYYPNLLLDVREHELSPSLHKTYQKSFEQDKIKTIVVLGAIGFEKGVDIVYGLKKIIEQQHAPVRLVVIGYTSKQNKAYKSASGHFEITGPYDPLKISDLLAEKRACLVIIPSIWPETFSYTTGEAIASGYPVIVFNIGAPAERVKRENAGVVVSEINVDAMWKAISRKLNLEI